MQQNKALCVSWAPHRAGRTEYVVTNDDVENVEQQSKHVLVLKLVFQIVAHRGALSRPAENVKQQSKHVLVLKLLFHIFAFAYVEGLDKGNIWNKSIYIYMFETHF